MASGVIWGGSAGEGSRAVGGGAVAGGGVVVGVVTGRAGGASKPVACLIVNVPK